VKYFRPENQRQLFDLLAEFSPAKRTLLAGGTDLMPRYENGLSLPENLIDLKKISDFIGITEADTEIVIGSLTSIETLKNSSLIHDHFHALWQATNQFAGVQIRHRATLGGNICNASPAGDTLPALYAHEASVRLISSSGQSELPIGDFITGPGTTALRKGEILQAVILPKRSGFSTFYKLGLRQAMAISVLNFAVVGTINSHGFSQLKIAAGAVAPTVKYLDQFTEAVKNNGKAIEDLIDLVDQDIAPIDDIRATGNYRRRVLKNVLAFTLTGLLNK